MVTCEVIILLGIVLIFCSMIVHWFIYNESTQLLIILLLFYMVKTLSDISLIISKPEGAIWTDFKILEISI